MQKVKIMQKMLESVRNELAIESTEPRTKDELFRWYVDMINDETQIVIPHTEKLKDVAFYNEFARYLSSNYSIDEMQELFEKLHSKNNRLKLEIQKKQRSKAILNKFMQNQVEKE